MCNIAKIVETIKNATTVEDLVTLQGTAEASMFIIMTQ